MEKQVRRFKVDFDFNWTYGVEIKKLKEDLDMLEKLGVTEIEIEAEEIYGSTSVKIEAFINRIETDEECKARVDKENQRQEEIKRRELEQLEKLKSKYGQ
jgi:hypothetical protein